MTRHHGTACRLPGRRPRGHFPTGLSGPWLAALVLCVLLGACGSSPRATAPSPGALVTSPAATSQQAAGSAAQAVSNVFRSPLLKPQLFVTDGAVFVAWQTSLPGSAAVLSELARIDAATGRIQARQLFSAYVPQVLEAGGSLWVAAWTGSVSASETLLKLNPDTLGVTRRWHIGTGGESAWAAQVLAVAHGGLWTAAGNRLVRVSLPSGKMTATVALPGADSSDVSANAAGTKLVVGEANSEGLGAVQRRDTTTGALLASHRVLGVAAPAVAGPAGSAVWISEATGMQGYVQRLDAASMSAAGSTCAEGRITRTCVPGDNDVTARVADGLLWVTQEAGGNARNYCADPVDGRRLAAIELPQPNDDLVLAIGPHQIFYAAPGPKASEYLRQEPMPRACRAR